MDKKMNKKENILTNIILILLIIYFIIHYIFKNTLIEDSILVITFLLVIFRTIYLYKKIKK